MSTKDDLSSRLRLLRKELGLSQKAEAMALEVRQATVSDWERGKTAPGTGTLRILADLTDSPEEVYNWLHHDGSESPEIHPQGRWRRTVHSGVVRSVSTTPNMPPLPPTPTPDIILVGEAAEAHYQSVADWVREVAIVAGQADTVPSTYLLEVSVSVLRACEVIKGLAEKLPPEAMSA